MTRYFDEFEVGDVFKTEPITLDAAEIIDFAVKLDPQSFHVDEQAAKASPFGGLIASGFHTMSAAWGQFLRLGLIADSGMGGPGLDEVRWPAPVRAGDRLETEVEVLEVRPSRSKPDRGIIRWRFTVRNQEGKTVCTFTGISFIKRRPAP